MIIKVIPYFRHCQFCINQCVGNLHVCIVFIRVGHTVRTVCIVPIIDIRGDYVIISQSALSSFIS